jgi:hypothetical protein
MRIYADINRLPDAGAEPDLVIIQVAPTPAVGSAPVPINGKFYVDIPDGVSPPAITAASKLLGGASIIPEIFTGLLSKFPKYSFVRSNTLLVSADVAALDLAATFPASAGPPPVAWTTRAQVGRGAGPGAVGLAPNAVAILAQNNTTSPVRPGLLITDTIDISADIPAGASELVVYWKIHEYGVTSDVMDYDSPSPGTNTAAIKQLSEVNQSPADFEVYLSTNDGTGYSLVSRLIPCAVCGPGTLIRLAFVNKSTTKRYLASYAILY